MNTYVKYCPNVFVAKCPEPQTKGETITMTTKYGKEHECIVFNLVGRTKDGHYLYSVVRADGFNHQEWAKRRAEKQYNAAARDEKRSHAYWEAAQEGKDFLVLAEPIKIGHHSEKRHRALIDRNYNRMKNCVEADKEAKAHQAKAEYWESRANEINLSMPESLEYYEFKLEQAKAHHQALKDGTTPRSHSYSLTYAKKDVNELQKKLQMAQKLWGE